MSTRCPGPRLTVIVASTRPGRVGRQIADWFAGQARTRAGFETTVADLAELSLPLLDEPNEPADRRYLHQHTRDWSGIVESADLLVFVMPEYNRGFNAALKNAIDYLYHEWNDKPVGLVCYGMSSGGLRAAQMIQPVLSAVGMVPVPTTVSVPLRQYLDPSQRLCPTEQLNRSATALLDDLERFGRALARLPGSAAMR